MNEPKTTPMKFEIGQAVLVTPKCGPAGGQEFVARIVKVNQHDRTYVVIDQEEDGFTIDEDELKEYVG
jgi:hypothetical protein